MPATSYFRNGELKDVLFGVYGQVSAQVRKICTKQNVINRHDVAQHAKHRVACGKSRIPIHRATAGPGVTIREILCCSGMCTSVLSKAHLLLPGALERIY